MYIFSVMTTQTTEKQDGLKALEGAIELIKNKIISSGGTLSIEMAPKVIFYNFLRFFLNIVYTVLIILTKFFFILSLNFNLIIFLFTR